MVSLRCGEHGDEPPSSAWVETIHPLNKKSAVEHLSPKCHRIGIGPAIESWGLAMLVFLRARETHPCELEST